MADVAYAIVGGGVVGRAIALELAQKKPGEDVVVIERCPKDRVENQSTRNSGVIHAGIYYRKSQRPIKAELCVTGNRLLYEFCAAEGVAHARTGKLVVATSEQEEGYLHGIWETAKENLVPDTRMLTADEVRAKEPNIRATAALWCPTSGVIDSAGYLSALRRAGSSHNLFATEVIGIRPTGDGFEIDTRHGQTIETFTARVVINAAGSHADRIAKMANPNCDFELVPVRGEAAKFYNTSRPELRLGGHNIYPAPYGFYPGGKRADVSYHEFIRLLGTGEITETVGVHLTPTLDEEGNIAATTTIGPAIHAGIAKDDLASNLYPPAHYSDAISEFFPSIRESDVQLHQAGIQARMAGQLDWHIQNDVSHDGFVNVLGIDSPGMTGSLAIARYVVERLL